MEELAGSGIPATERILLGAPSAAHWCSRKGRYLECASRIWPVGVMRLLQSGREDVGMSGIMLGKRVLYD